MRLDDYRTSDNVSDQGQGGGGFGGGGGGLGGGFGLILGLVASRFGIGGVLILLLGYCALTTLGGGGGTGVVSPGAPGVASGVALAAMEGIAARTLPAGFDYEWTGLAYQEQGAGDSTALVFLLAVLLVFLVLAAQYESLTLPLAIIMIVPMGLLAAMAGVWLTDGDNNVFTQIGLIVLVGLSAKNAILIVEFARELEFAGRTPLAAAIESLAGRLGPVEILEYSPLPAREFMKPILETTVDDVRGPLEFSVLGAVAAVQAVEVAEGQHRAHPARRPRVVGKVGDVHHCGSGRWTGATSTSSTSPSWARAMPVGRLAEVSACGRS